MVDNTQSLQPDQLAAEILQDRPLLRQKLARALFCSPTDCETALCETIKFLILAAENNHGQLTPSARVDLAWHEFILFTRTYLGFCEQYLGKMIHHEPSNDHEVNSQQYSITLTRYRNRFGEPPSGFWPSGFRPLVFGGGASLRSNQTNVSASCGNCETDE